MRERAEQSGDAARILEHLEQFAVGEVAASILERSLERAGVRSLPPDAVGLGLFVCGPLRDAAEAALGAEQASAIVKALSPLYEADVALARSGIRGKRPKRAQTARTVLVASPDARRGERLAARLRSDARVHVAGDLFRLMQLAEAHLAEPLTVLIDGSVPGLRGPMLGTLARLLPESARLILWGVPPMPTLPIAVETLPREATVEDAVERVLGADEPEPAPLRLVVADDDAVWRATLTRRLRFEGYEVIACADGFEALEACIDNLPALVLTDYDMPALDGLQLAALLRTRFGADAPPVVMLTSSDVQPDENVESVLRKSGRFHVLLDTLSAYLDAPSPR